MLPEKIKFSIQGAYRGTGVTGTNKKLSALENDLRRDFPEYFYSEKDARLKDRVFFHNPFNIPHKSYIKDVAYVTDDKGKFLPTED